MKECSPQSLKSMEWMIANGFPGETSEKEARMLLTVAKAEVRLLKRGLRHGWFREFHQKKALEHFLEGERK